MPSEPRRRRSTGVVPVGEVLDEVNTRLLLELQADPRIAMSELARRIGMSPPATTERLERLQRAGVVTGYRVEVDPAAIGLPVTAFVRVRPAAGQLSRVAELAVSTPQVSECHRITGEDCFLLKVHAPSVERLGDVLERFQFLGQTVTSIVVATPVPTRPVPLVGAPDTRPPAPEM